MDSGEWPPHTPPRNKTTYPRLHCLRQCWHMSAKREEGGREGRMKGESRGTEEWQTRRERYDGEGSLKRVSTSADSLRGQYTLPRARTAGLPSWIRGQKPALGFACCFWASYLGHATAFVTGQRDAPHHLTTATHHHCPSQFDWPPSPPPSLFQV